MPDDLVMDTIDLESTYRAEMRSAAFRYMASNKVGYHAICEDVGSYWRGKPGTFRRIMAEIEKRCSLANGFPESYDAWLSTRSPESAPE